MKPTKAQWDRRTLVTSLCDVLGKVASARSFDALTDDQIREATAVLEKIAALLGG